jgi:AraC-like DNA-binding protein
MRVEEARRRLASPGASITTISYELGFSSSQYFATVVKRYTGRTPGQLRAVAGI